jgi:hypothetical protein
VRQHDAPGGSFILALTLTAKTRCASQQIGAFRRFAVSRGVFLNLPYPPEKLRQNLRLPVALVTYMNMNRRQVTSIK